MRKMLVAVLGILAGLLIVACAGATPAPAQPKTVAEIAAYQGPDRQQILEDGARKEGKLSLYTTLRLETPLNPLLKEFKARYPYIDVAYWIAGGAQIPERVRAEREAGRYEVDVVSDTSYPPDLAELGWAIPYYSPYAQAYERKDPEGRWVAHMTSPRGLAYNTKLVSRDQIPTTWKGLLDPKWRGKVALSGQDTSTGMVIGAWLDSMGQESGMDFIKALAKNGTIVSLGMASRGVADQVIAGEYPMCICAVTHIEVSKAAGAPIDYVVPEGPVSTITDMLALVKNAPNPHAGLLWIDFMLDPRGGGEVKTKEHFISLDPENLKVVPQLVGREMWPLTSERNKKINEWMGIFKEYLMK